MIAEPGQQFHYSVIVGLVLHQLLPEFFLTGARVRAEVAVDLVDDNDPVFVERSVVADVAVCSGQSLGGEEHAGVVGQIYHYVGILGVGEVDTALTVQQVLQVRVPVSDDGHLLPRHHSNVTQKFQVEINLQTELVVVLLPAVRIVLSYLVERGQAVFPVHQLGGGHLLRQLKLAADHLKLGADPHHSPVTVVLQGLVASLTALSKQVSLHSLGVVKQ